MGSRVAGRGSPRRRRRGRGFQVFSHLRRVLCHTPPLFSDALFHNIGIGSDKPPPDMGRGKILADAADKNNQPVTRRRAPHGRVQDPQH